LLIEKLKLATNIDSSPEIHSVAESLKVHSAAMRDNIERTTRSVDSVMDLLRSLVEKLNEMRVITLANQNIMSDVDLIKQSREANAKLAVEMKTISEEINQLLKGFKLPPPTPKE
jgi:hypothetical protein